MIKIVLKHYIKLLVGRSDPHWRFFAFEQKINPLTWKNRESILAWAEKCLEKNLTMKTRDFILKATILL